jgi:hypothetical protein
MGGTKPRRRTSWTLKYEGTVTRVVGEWRRTSDSGEKERVGEGPGRVPGWVPGARSLTSTVGTEGSVTPWGVEERRGENGSVERGRMEDVGSGESNGDLW